MSATMPKVDGYDAGAMILHWTIALAVFFQLAIGFAMSRLSIFPRDLQFLLFQWHKTVGILVLALTLARIAWRLFNPPPAHAPMPAAERALAGLVHALFYALMLVVPLSGWLLVSSAPARIPTFLFLSQALPWPNLPLPGGIAPASLYAAAGTAHVWLAYSFVVLIGLHVAGALKHSLLDRAPSFSRMVPVGGLPRQSARLIAVPTAAAIAAAFVGSGLLAARNGVSAPPATATVASGSAAIAAGSGGWAIDKAASRLDYSVTFSGRTIAGTVGAFDASVVFDPDDLAAAHAEVSIPSESVGIDDAVIGPSLAGPDGLDSAAQPTIKVALKNFSRTADGFLGRGTIAMKSTELPIEVPFDFASDSNGTAHVTGTARIDRIAFGLGVANDSTAAWLGKDIDVRLDLRAMRRE